MSRTRSGARRTLIVVATALVATAILIALHGGKKGQGDIYDRPSTYFTDDSGAMGAFLTLQRFFPEVRRWRQPLTMLPLQPGEPGVMVVMQPMTPLDWDETQAVREWLAQGGCLIMALHGEWEAVFPSAASEQGEPSSQAPSESEADETSEPPPPGVDFLEELGFTLQNDAISMENLRDAAPLVALGAIVPSSEITALAAHEDRILAAGRRLGAGQVIAIADGAVFSNGRLREASQNAAWLAERCAEWGGPVWFNERVHGFGDRPGLFGLLWRFSRTPWGLIFVQLALAGALFALLTRSRFGPVREPRVDSPHDPLALIAARAGFLKAAKARAFSLDAIHKFTARRLREYGKTQARDAIEGRFKPSARDEQGLRDCAVYAEWRRRATQSRSSDEDFTSCARLGGEILQEYRHERIDL